MNNKVERKLTWYLRHAPSNVDEAGWKSIIETIKFLNITKSTLIDLVVKNSKQRFELHKNKIRACQGHSFGCGVTYEGLEHSWNNDIKYPILYHRTNSSNVASIFKEALLAKSRTHVHCVSAINSKVGRLNGDVLIHIDPTHLTYWTASNGVVLIRYVPKQNLHINFLEKRDE